MAIYIFYHIFCNERTIPIIKSQIIHIIFSGLYAKCDAIYCYLSTDKDKPTNPEPKTLMQTLGSSSFNSYLQGNIDDDLQDVRNIIQTYGKKFIIKNTSYKDTSYERFTLLDIRNVIKPEDKFLYIHSKGVSHKQPDFNIDLWRVYMEYFLMCKHEKCISLLDDYDAVGVEYIPSRKMYNGNFWWSRGSYFLTLPPAIGPNYNDPEYYISLCNPDCFNFQTTNNNFYSEPYVSNNYVDL
jgi:hypothetical protein